MGTRRSTASSAKNASAAKSASAAKTASAVHKHHAIVKPSSMWYSICSKLLPNLLVIAAAVAAVWFELTTSEFYVHSPELLSLLKRSFIFWVCLAVRAQLTDFVTPSKMSRRPPSLRKEMNRHVRALFAAITANLLGTAIIRPIFSATPQFEDTVRLVVPMYFLVEVVVDVFHFPMPLLKTIIGLSVSWLKAITIPKLVKEWQSGTSAHPLGFLAISTANLYASGVVLRYMTHYGRTGRVVDLSMGAVGFLLQIVGTSGVVGVVAHVANHFKSIEDRVLEARVLYFCVAWFALNKYWKKAVRELLLSMFTSPVKSKTA